MINYFSKKQVFILFSMMIAGIFISRNNNTNLYVKLVK